MSPTTFEKVDKFDGTNYPLWSFKMKMYLRSRGLWGQVDGSAPLDLSLMEQAHAAIVLSLTDSQVLHVVATTTAVEAWAVLRGMNESRDMASRMWLKEKFATFRFTTSTMEKHFEELEALVLQMGSAGCRPDEDDLCATLLRSLPSSFDGLVQAFRMSVGKFTYGDVMSRVLAEDIRQKEQGRIEQETAMLAGRNKQVIKKNGFDKRAVTCYQCGKRGHFKRDCPNAGNDAYESNVAFHADITHGGVCREWVVDSGASNHMCASRDAFVEYRADHGGRTVSIAKSGATLRVLGTGIVLLRMNVGARTVCARLENTLHVENLSRNLFSIPAILSKAMRVNMDSRGCKIVSNGAVVGSGRKRGNLIYLDVVGEAGCHIATDSIGAAPTQFVRPSRSTPVVSGDLWHRRFGHASREAVKKALASNSIVMGDVSTKVCDVCELSKQARKPFPVHDDHGNASSDVVCSDVLGPVTPASRSGCTYAVTFIMMKTRFVKVYPIMRKSDVLAKFIEFRQYMQTQTGVSVRAIRSDNGGEYASRDMKSYCVANNVRQEFTIPHNPQQNGMAERANRTLVEMTRCMLKDSGLSKSLWAEALVTAAYVRNTISTTARPHTTPYKETFKRQFEYGRLRVFGSVCYAHVPKTKRLKFDDSGVRCRMLGYLETSKGYRLLNLETGQILHSRSVTFDETASTSRVGERSDPVLETESVDIESISLEPRQTTIEKPEHGEHQLQVLARPDERSIVQAQDPSGGAMTPVQYPPYDCTDIVPTDLEESMSPRSAGRLAITSVPSGTPDRDGMNQRRVRPARKKRGVVQYEDEFNGMRRGEFNLDDYEDEIDGLHCYTTVLDDERQSTYAGIMRSEMRQQWKSATDAEMQSLAQHHTWDLVNLPSGKKLIGSRWLFKVKRNADGSVNKFKARLVAQGFTQKYGIDFNETFAPVAKQSTVRTVLAIAAGKDLEAEQVDVDTAFLFAPIDDELYIKQPDGFEDAEYPNKVCLLRKSLYGTKQAARQWNKTLDDFFRSMDFVRADADPCLYTRTNDSEYSAVVVYVDDMIVVSNDSVGVRKIIKELKTKFSIKELGEPRFILGIEVTRDRSARTITLSQRGYILQLAERFRMMNAKPVYLPADANSRLTRAKDDALYITNVPYRELVGSLMYIVTCTRPDIADAVGNVAKYCEQHTSEHWSAAKRILKFLMTTREIALVYDGKKPGDLIGFADASWASDEDTRRSTTGYVFMLCGAAVSWRSQRQPTVAGSSTEAEYMGLYFATQEMVWLRRLLKDLKMLKDEPTTVYQDNQGAIAIAKNPVFNSRTKHVDTKYHFSRERVEANELRVEYMPTGTMVANALTKSVARPKLEQFQYAVGLKPLNRVSIKGGC